MKKFILKGQNDKFPTYIETWKLGEILPEWLTDRCKIKNISKYGELVPDIREYNTGGYSLVASGSTSEYVVKTKSKDDLICYSESGAIFSLTPKQFNILYKKLEEKGEK